MAVAKKENLSCVISMNVGCAAFFIHIKGDEFVIIDAGAKGPMIKSSGYYEQLTSKYKFFTILSSIFKKCTLKGVVITHPDSDHCSLLKPTLELYIRKHEAIHDSPIPIIIGGNKYMQELYKISEACREFKQFGQFVSNSAAIGEHSILLQLMDHMITLKDKHMMFLTRSELTYNDLDETRPTSINAYSLICYIDGMIYTGDANAGTVDLRTGFGCLITTEDCKLNPKLDLGQVTSYDIDGFYEKIKSVGGYVYGMVFPHHGSISEGSRGVRNALLQKTMKLVFIPNSANNKSQVSQEGPSQVQNTTTQSRLLKITSTRPTLESLSKLVALHHTDNAIASIAVWSEKDPSYYPTVFECDIKGNIKYVTHIPLKEDDVKVVGYTAGSK